MGLENALLMLEICIGVAFVGIVIGILFGGYTPNVHPKRLPVSTRQHGDIPDFRS